MINGTDIAIISGIIPKNCTLTDTADIMNMALRYKPKKNPWSAPRRYGDMGVSIFVSHILLHDAKIHYFYLFSCGVSYLIKDFVDL